MHLNDDNFDSRLVNLCYGTQSDNIRDCVAKGRNRNASKTRCPKGHEYTPENTYWRKDGRGRQCNACNRANQAARYRNKKSKHT